MVYPRLVLFAAWAGVGHSFLQNIPYPATRHANSSILLSADRESASISTTEPAESRVASQLKVLTCASTSCAKKRKDLGQDEYATFSELYVRAKETFPTMTVEESTCLGCCKAAPCVGIEHEEYEGTVALEGMTDNEFSDRVFQNICFVEDVDRVWQSIENAVQVLASEEYDDDDNGGDEPTETQGVEA
eukprot:scaffold3337_cov169-Amphora_coffeaeformis.AAC.40